MKLFALALTLLLAAVPAQAQDAGAAANRFYTTWLAQPRAGMPSPTARAQLQPMLSARLGKLVAQAAAAEARFRAVNKFAPPLLEGDIFSSLSEGAVSFKLGACTGSATAQRCRIQSHRPQELKARAARPADWGDDLLLVQEGGGWKVDDVDYRGGFAYGNTGLLSQTLAIVIQAAS